MDELARRAIGELTKRVADLETTEKALIAHQSQADKRIGELMSAVDKLTTIAARLAGVA